MVALAFERINPNIIFNIYKVFFFVFFPFLKNDLKGLWMRCVINLLNYSICSQMSCFSIAHAWLRLFSQDKLENIFSIRIVWTTCILINAKIWTLILNAKYRTMFYIHESCWPRYLTKAHSI
jgi:hypothetical protein